MNLYGQATHHLMAARNTIEQREPESNNEKHTLALARFHLDATIMLIRKLHRMRQ